jgi:transposase
MNGILWVLRSGARWEDLPERFPPHQTRHRRFQQWVREGVLRSVLEAFAEDLRVRGELDLSECFIDGMFVSAKKGARSWKNQAGHLRKTVTPTQIPVPLSPFLLAGKRGRRRPCWSSWRP